MLALDNGSAIPRLRCPRSAWAASVLTLGVYVVSMARDLSFYDSAELALVAVQGGVSHPPGHPLYLLLAHIFAHLPGFSPLFGLNLLSALCGALAVVPVLYLSERALESVEIDPRPSGWLRAAIVVVGAQHAALWDQATRVEVYAPAVLLALVALVLLERGLSASSTRGLCGAGLSLGLTAAVNPVIAVFAFVAGAPAVLFALHRRRARVRDIALLGLVAVSCLAFYAYVPVVARDPSVFAWGRPTSGEALVDYLTGRDFATNLSVSGARWLAQVVHWFGWALGAALLPLWIVGLLGQLMMPVAKLGRWPALLAAAASVAYLARYEKFRPDVPDYVSYVSLATWLLLAGCASLAAQLWERRARIGACGVVAIVGVCALVSPPGLFARTRAQDHSARSLAEALLASAPVGSLLFVDSDHWAMPLFYLQEVEHRRTDVSIVAVGLGSSSWFWERLFQRHPDLRPIPLRGQGGKLGRFARLLDANRERPVLFEDPGLAAQLGLEVCLGSWFSMARAPCAGTSPSGNVGASTLIGLLRDVVEEGEPTAIGALCSVAAARGEALWRRGDGGGALATFLSCVPHAQLPALPEAVQDRVKEIAPLRAALRPPQRQTPLGDPAWNVFLSAHVLLSAGHAQEAARYMGAAARLGLPEALAAVGTP